MARILVVDDDESIRFLVREELSLDGHTVRTAEDGCHGLRAVEEEVPDVVVLDIRMPGLDGLEVLRRLKARYPRLPVILFTAYSDFGDEGRTIGADAYLIKSPNMERLRQTVASVTTGLY